MLYQEICRDAKTLFKTTKASRLDLDKFCENSGLDLSDLLYKKSCYDAFCDYMKTGVINQEIKGLDYSAGIVAGWFNYMPIIWLSKHYFRG